jgi:hypothetical protein
LFIEFGRCSLKWSWIVMMSAMMATIMSDLHCMSSSYDFITFENNCVSELFSIGRRTHRHMSFLLAIQHVHWFCGNLSQVQIESHCFVMIQMRLYLIALLDLPVLCPPSDATERCIWLFNLPVMHLRARVAQSV